MNDPDRLLTVAEAAERLGITSDALRAKIRRGTVEAQRDNRGRWRVRLSDAAATVDERPSRPSTPTPDAVSDDPRLALALAERDLYRARADAALKDLLADHTRLIEALEAHVEDLRTQLATAEERRQLLEAELMSFLRKPWWRRLFGR